MGYFIFLNQSTRTFLGTHSSQLNTLGGQLDRYGINTPGTTRTAVWGFSAKAWMKSSPSNDWKEIDYLRLELLEVDIYRVSFSPRNTKWNDLNQCTPADSTRVHKWFFKVYCFCTIGRKTTFVFTWVTTGFPEALTPS
jgi:hypothetical protein